MKTISVNIYSFDELSDRAKQIAISEYRQTIDNSFYWDEAHETVKSFHKLFGTKEGCNSWLDINTGNIDDNILQLKGLRLQKYIWNNFKIGLYKGKYFSLWSKTDISYKHYVNGYPVLKSRHSRVMLDNSCTLTGMCYDMDILDPIYDFLNKYRANSRRNDDMTFRGLLEYCIDSLKRSLESEDEYRYSDDGIIEDISQQALEFTENGKIC